MTRFIVMAAVLASSIPADAGECAVRDPSAVAVTAKDAVIEDGGGVIVGIGFTGEKSLVPDIVLRRDWRFRDGGRLVEPTIDKIAPGVAVYRLPASKTQGYTLETGNHTPIVNVRRSPDRDTAVLPAPMPTGGELTVFSNPRDRGEFVTLHLIGPAPRGVVGLVVYGVDDKPRSFETVQPGMKDPIVYRSRGRCALAIPGEIATHAGDTITVAWLDASGRLSAKSRSIMIDMGAITQ